MIVVQTLLKVLKDNSVHRFSRGEEVDLDIVQITFITYDPVRKVLSWTEVPQVGVNFF